MHSKYFIAHDEISENVDEIEWIECINSHGGFSRVFLYRDGIQMHSVHTRVRVKKSKDEYNQMIIKIHDTYIYMIKCQYRRISDGALKN